MLKPRTILVKAHEVQTKIGCVASVPNCSLRTTKTMRGMKMKNIKRESKVSIKRRRVEEKRRERKTETAPKNFMKTAHKNRLLSLYRRVLLGYYVYFRDALSRA